MNKSFSAFLSGFLLAVAWMSLGWAGFIFTNEYAVDLFIAIGICLFFVLMIILSIEAFDK